MSSHFSFLYEKDQHVVEQWGRPALPFCTLLPGTPPGYAKITSTGNACGLSWSSVVRRVRQDRNVCLQQPQAQETEAWRTGWELTRAQVLACLAGQSCQLCSSPEEAGGKSWSTMEDRLPLRPKKKRNKTACLWPGGYKWGKLIIKNRELWRLESETGNKQKKHGKPKSND